MPSDVNGEEAADGDRLRILELLEQQKITAAEAAELLSAEYPVRQGVLQST